MKNKSLSWIPLEAGLISDREAKVLYGVQVAMLGEAKGHGFELDDVTLDKIVELGNASPNGIKVRFGHPSMCTPALGTFLGVRKNFRRDGQYVRADLHMSKAADPEKAMHVLTASDWGTIPLFRRAMSISASAFAVASRAVLRTTPFTMHWQSASAPMVRVSAMTAYREAVIPEV